MSLITWPLMGLRLPLGQFVLLNCAGILSGAALLQMVGALSANFEQANMLSMVVLMLAMMFSPAFMRVCPKWLEWARNISFIGKLSEMTMYLEFKDVHEVFEGQVSAEEVYELYSVGVRSDEDFWWAAWILFATWVVARVIAYLSVKFLHTGQSISEVLSQG
jgi:hypothetical protein